MSLFNLEILDYFKKNKVLIFKICALTSLIAGVGSLVLKDTYVSNSIITPTRDNYKASSGSQLGSIAQSIGFAADDATPELKFALAYFNSYRFLAEFIYKFDLIDELLYFERYDKKSKKLVISEEANSVSRERLFPDGKIDLSNPLLQEAVKELRKIVRLSPGRENDPSMYMSAFHQSPNFAYFLNLNLINYLNKDISSIDIRESKEKIRFMEGMFAEYEAVEVKRALTRLVENEITKQVIANSVDGDSFLILDPPLIPHKKYSPRRLVIVINALLFGVLLSIVYLSITFIRSKENGNNEPI